MAAGAVNENVNVNVNANVNANENPLIVMVNAQADPGRTAPGT